MDETDTDSTTRPDQSSTPAGRGWTPPWSRRLVTLSLVAAVLAVGGTWVATHPMSSADKAGDGVRRTDLTSLSERMPALAIGRAAVWYSGWMAGQSTADEPMATWMDAVVTLPGGRAADLAEAYSTAVATDPPDVVADLVTDVPDGTLQTSEALDDALSTPYWHASAYLSVPADQLVLVVEGRSTAP